MKGFLRRYIVIYLQQEDGDDGADPQNGDDELVKMLEMEKHVIQNGEEEVWVKNAKNKETSKA